MIEPYFFALNIPTTVQVLYRRRKIEELEVLHKYVDKERLLAEIQHKNNGAMLDNSVIEVNLHSALSTLLKRKGNHPCAAHKRVDFAEVEILFRPDFSEESAKGFEIVSSKTIEETDGARLIEVIVIAK